MAGRRERSKQGALPFRSWGGPRPGAGRKPTGARAGVSHRARGKHVARFPAHVTVRLRNGLPGLRSRPVYAALRAAFAAGCQRFGFRLVQYSVQRDHIHFVAEAQDRRALVRGIQGLLIRVAKALNRLWNRRGSVFADRYHDRALRTPREVRSCLAYVLNNGRRHGLRFTQAVDLYSSACWFDGWREKLRVKNAPLQRPTAAARTWLLAAGWRRSGLIAFDEVPGAP